jgi:hypothetical protein
MDAEEKKLVEVTFVTGRITWDESRTSRSLRGESDGKSKASEEASNFESLCMDLDSVFSFQSKKPRPA